MKNFLKISLPIFVICIFLIELGFRFLDTSVDLMGLTGKKEVLNPMLAKWAKNEPFFSYSAAKSFPLEGKTINSYNFVSTPEIKLEKDSLTTRIAFLGGSSTAGTGKLLTDEETWPWKVADALNAKGYKVDFINAALSGYSTFESYGVLWSKLRFFNPDIVIINHGWNDFSYFEGEKPELINYRKNEEKIYEGVNFLMKYETVKPMKIDKYVAFSQILSRLRLLIWNEKGLGEVVPFDDGYGSGDSNGIVENHYGKITFQQNLELIKSFCDLYQIESFFCLQPTLIFNENNTIQFDTESERVAYYKEHIEHYKEIYTIIKDVSSKENWIDLTEMSYTKSCFLDHIHPSPFGTDLITSIVTDSLMSNYFE